MSKRSVLALLMLLIFSGAPMPAEARGFGGGRAVAGGRAVGSRTIGNSARAGGGSLLRGSLLRGGRRGRRGGYNTGNNLGTNADQEQAAYFESRRSANPYNQVAEHINVANYIKTYH